MLPCRAAMHDDDGGGGYGRRFRIAPTSTLSLRCFSAGTFIPHDKDELALSCHPPPPHQGLSCCQPAKVSHTLHSCHPWLDSSPGCRFPGAALGTSIVRLLTYLHLSAALRGRGKATSRNRPVMRAWWRGGFMEQESPARRFPSRWARSGPLNKSASGWPAPTVLLFTPAGRLRLAQRRRQLLSSRHSARLA